MIAKHHEDLWTKLVSKLELRNMKQAKRVLETRKTGQEMQDDLNIYSQPDKTISSRAT